jgi:hypothetical protein
MTLSNIIQALASDDPYKLEITSHSDGVYVLIIKGLHVIHRIVPRQDIQFLEVIIEDMVKSVIPTA